ncbi:MAG: c-type cytochrome [Aureispira sp.]|nr:c-type cytochrome [Aureispira sp.]
MKTRITLFFTIVGLLILTFGAETKTNANSVAELGEELFMDTILSRDYTLSCGSCHIPEFAFSDTSAVSVGVDGQLGDRNTPSAMNMTARSSFFWDGRSATLEEQALEPIKNPVEMDLSIDSAIARLRANTYYNNSFIEIFGEAPNATNLATALAEFERTLETGSAFDRFMAGDSSAISASAMRGQDVFNVKGKCFDCHLGPDFTGDEFRNIGTFDMQKYKDLGRFDATKDSADLGKFKVPGLRNIAVTGPYMHDGSFKTLREIIDYYNTPDDILPHAMNRDTLLREPLNLTEQEMVDLEAFMESLTADQFLHLIPKKD